MELISATSDLSSATFVLRWKLRTKGAEVKNDMERITSMKGSAHFRVLY